MPTPHLLLYGPPAAGKVTVANAIAERSAMRVIDNHATVDLVLRLFEFGTKPFQELVDKMRFDLAAVAAREGVAVVSTLVFAPTDRPYVKRLAEVVEASGGVMCRARLVPPADVLEARVVQPSRGAFQKVQDVALLRQILDNHDCYSSINDDDLTIDNSSLGPSDVAEQICRHFGIA